MGMLTLFLRAAQNYLLLVAFSLNVCDVHRLSPYIFIVLQSLRFVSREREREYWDCSQLANAINRPSDRADTFLNCTTQTQKLSLSRSVCISYSLNAKEQKETGGGEEAESDSIKVAKENCTRRKVVVHKKP